MKPSKRIFLLIGLVSALVVFWLVPEINTASPVRYTRIYEDTDLKPVTVNNPDTTKRISYSSQEEDAAVKKKLYKSESIEADATLKDIDVKMYSRAVHYHEEVQEMPLVLEADTVMEIDLEVTDSVYYALIDTLGVNQ